MMRLVVAARVAGAIVAALGHLGVASAQDATYPHLIDNIRDTRYCELFVVTGRLEPVASVYNTLGLDDCPPDVWKAIDLDKVKQQFDAEAVIVNGPRHFIMDRIETAEISTEPTDVQGLDMRVVAKIEISLKDRLFKPKPYTVHTIDRTTRYTFRAGQPVYELVAPDGRVFVMQAYAEIVDPNLAYDQLDGLAGRLKLPEGWQYRPRVPDSDLVMATTGKAEIIQDDLDNTYQLMTP